MFRIIGISMAVLVALLFSAALAIWLYFDPNDYKDYLSEQVQSRTGRAFSIEDDLELTFFPWLGVQTGGIRLGDAEGFGEQDFVSVRRATARVRLLPLLLERRIEIGTVELTGMELNLSQDAEGRGNWADLLADTAPAESDAAVPTEAAFALQDLNIAGIDVRDGRVFWRENVDDVRYVISDLSVDTGPIVIGQPIDADLGFQLVSVDPQFTARIDASTTATADLNGARYSAEDLALEFRLQDGRHEERASGTLRASLRFSADDGTIEFAESEIDAELTNPPVGPSQFTLAASWEGASVDLNGQTVTLRGLTTEAAGILARWEVAAENILDDAALSGSLRIDGGSLEAALALADVSLDTAVDLGTFDLRSGFSFRPSTGELVLSEPSGAALDMRVSGALAVNAAGIATGRIAIPAFNPTRLFAILPTAELQDIDLSSVDRVALSTGFTFNAADGGLSLREMNAELLGATLTGGVERLDDGRRYRGTLQTTDIDPNRAVAVAGNLLPEGLGPDELGTLRLSTRFDYDTAADVVALSEVDAQALGLRASGTVSVSELSDSPRLAGGVRIQRFSPRSLFARFDQPVPVTADESALTNVTVDASVDITAERGEFGDIRVQLDDSTVTGEFTVEDFDNPRYRFTLAIDQVDVDRYLPPGTEPTQADAEAGSPEVELPTQALHDLAIVGQVEVGDLKIAGLRINDVAANLSVGDGLGSVELARSRLYGGQFKGELELDVLGNRPALAVSGTAATIQIDPLMRDFSGDSVVSGSGTFDLALAGNGNTINEALRTSGGHVDFALADGVIRGFNLGHALCTGYNALEKLPRPAPAESDATAYRIMRGRAQVSEGIARTRDLQATTAFMEVTGQGQLDLATRDVNYDVLATLTGSTGIRGCEQMNTLVGQSIPVKVRGNVTAPQVLPDFGEIVKRRIQNELEDRLRERLIEGLRR